MRLIVVVDCLLTIHWLTLHLLWLTLHLLWLHHNRLALHAGLHHALVYLTNQSLAHHVHHGVSSSHHLLLLHLLWLHLRGLTARHYWHLSKHVDVVRIVHVVHQVVDFSFADSLLLEEVLSCIQVHSHIVDLLQESFSLIHEVLRNWLQVLGGAHRKLVADHGTLSFRSRMRINVMLTHPVEKLAWKFIQGLLG